MGEAREVGQRETRAVGHAHQTRVQGGRVRGQGGEHRAAVSSDHAPQGLLVKPANIIILLSLYLNIINIINNPLSHLGSGTLAPPLSPASESVSADSGSVSGRRVSRELVSTKLCPEKISGLALDSRLEPDTAEAAASSSPEVSSLRWTRGCSSPAPAASRPRPVFLGLTSAAELSVTEVAASSSQLPPPRLLLLGVLPASPGVLGVRPPSV